MANPQAKLVVDPPIYTEIEKNGRITELWRVWTQQVNAAINRTGPVTQGGARAVSPVTVGASPWTYQSPFGGDVRLIVSGGTVSNIQVSRDSVTYYSLGVTAGQITLSQGDYIKITYTVVPTVIAVPA